MSKIVSGKISTMTLFRVVSNTDLNEGRGDRYTLGWYIDRGMAEQAAKGQYVFGSDCPIEEVEKLVVTLPSKEIHIISKDVVITKAATKEDEIRSKALKKLTQEERRVLGW